MSKDAWPAALKVLICSFLPPFLFEENQLQYSTNTDFTTGSWSGLLLEWNAICKYTRYAFSTTSLFFC